MSATARDPQHPDQNGPKLETVLTADKQPDPTVRDFSVVVGGPFYDFLLKAKLVSPGTP